MKSPLRRWIQILLAVMLLVVSVRLLWIFYQRRRPARPAAVAARPIPSDYYVHPPRAYLTDFESAERLKGNTVWARSGYRYGHFPYDARRRRSREIEDPPVLAPIERITIADVVREPTPKRGVEEINLIFEDPAAAPPFSPGSSPASPSTLRAVTIGHCDRTRDSCRFYFDEMFLLKDPRELYSHWPQETWEAVERGEVREGMSETQISFAVGFGRPLREETRAAGGDRVEEYRPPGRPALVVTFGSDGNARRIETK